MKLFVLMLLAVWVFCALNILAVWGINQIKEPLLVAFATLTVGILDTGVFVIVVSDGEVLKH